MNIKTAIELHKERMEIHNELTVRQHRQEAAVQFYQDYLEKCNELGIDKRVATRAFIKDQLKPFKRKLRCVLLIASIAGLCVFPLGLAFILISIYFVSYFPICVLYEIKVNDYHRCGPRWEAL